jgi:hypothetical protein
VKVLPGMCLRSVFWGKNGRMKINAHKKIAFSNGFLNLAQVCTLWLLVGLQLLDKSIYKVQSHLPPPFCWCGFLFHFNTQYKESFKHCNLTRMAHGSCYMIKDAIVAWSRVITQK